MKHFLYIFNSSVKIIFLSQRSSPYLIMNKLSTIFHPAYSEKPDIMAIFHKWSTSEGVPFCLLNLGTEPENWYTFYHEEEDKLAISVLIFQNVLITDKSWTELTEMITFSETLIKKKKKQQAGQTKIFPFWRHQDSSFKFFNRKKAINCKFCQVTMRKISYLHLLSHSYLLQKYLCQEFQLHLHSNIWTITSWGILQHRLATEWCSVDGLTCCGQQTCL